MGKSNDMNFSKQGRLALWACVFGLGWREDCMSVLEWTGPVNMHTT